MRRVVSMAGALLLVMSTGSFAQTMADSGQRVRVTRITGKKSVGVLQRVTAESVTVRDTVRFRDLVVPRSDIKLVERSLGMHRDFGGHFAKTFLISSGALGLIMAVTWTPCESTELFGCFLSPASRGEALGWGMVGGAVLGVPLGLFSGVVGRSERWSPITTKGDASGPRVSANFGGVPGRMGFVRITLRP